LFLSGQAQLYYYITRDVEKVIKLYNKVINQINDWVKDLAAIVLVLITILVVANVIVRVVFGSAIKGSYDMVIIATSVVISLSIAYCAVKDGHVAVSLFVQRLPFKVQKIIDFIISSIVIVILLLVTWYLVQHANTMRMNHEVTTTIGIPFAPFIIIIAVGTGMLALVVFGRVLNLFVKEGDQ